MATLERYNSFEEMKASGLPAANPIKKKRKKNNPNTIKEFALLLRKHIVSTPQPIYKKPGS